METLSSCAGLITTSLWSVSWQVTILVGIIWIIDRLSRRASSLFRYWLWCIVLLRLCVPVNVSLPENIGQFINSTIVINAPDINKIILTTAVEKTGGFISLERMVSANSTSLFDFTGFLWFLSVVFISALIIIRIFRIKHLLKDRIPIERPDILSLVRKHKNEMGIKCPVGIHYLNIDNIDVPAVIGIIHPRILFPRRIVDNWTIAEIEPILLHELAHIKRYDLFVNLLQVIIQVIYFFHPLVWYINWRIRKVREEVCDDITIKRLVSGRKGYTQSILRIVEETFKEPMVGFGWIGFYERKNNLGERIKRIMNNKYKLYKPLNLQSIAALFMISIVVFAFACENSEDNIQGVWMTTHLDDKEVKSEQTWSFSNNRLTIDHPDSSNIKYAGNFTINEKVYPKRIEFDLTEFKNGEPDNNITSIGIYKIEEDILVIKVNENGGGFPKDFKIEPTTDKINFKKLRQRING